MSKHQASNVLIITYYWPPSSGSGVQRWMYFTKYLSDYGITPIILTVNPSHASYRKIDNSFDDFVQDIMVYKTKTLEPLKLYSFITTGNTNKGIPQGGVGAEKKGLFSKISRYIRGNVFIPDARIGWKKFAVNQAKKIIAQHDIKLVVTTGPPHSTHLIGRVLKRMHGVKWITDMRDPWTEIYYNKDLLQSSKSLKKDRELEQSVLEESDHVLTIGPAMAELLSDKIPNQKGKVSYIYNGYDAKKMASVQGEKNKDYMVISFIGLLTDSMPHESFSSALKSMLKLNSETKIKLRLVGDICSNFLSTIQRILPKDNIEIVSYVTHREALRLMKSADVLFTCLPTQENSKIMISGKLLEYMATGNTILCIGDQESDAAKILSFSTQSNVCEPHQLNDIRDFLQDKYHLWIKGELQPSMPENISNMSRYKTTGQLADLLNKII